MPNPRDEFAGSAALQIGEAARALGVTPRTLRYWEEMGLLAPAAHRGGGERRYSESELERARHVRDLQRLAGLSLGDIRAVLETEAHIDDLRAAYRSDASAGGRRQLMTEAIQATEQLLGRIDERLAHLEDFRARLAERLQHRRQHLVDLGPGAEAGDARDDPSVETLGS